LELTIATLGASDEAGVAVGASLGASLVETTKVGASLCMSLGTSLSYPDDGASLATADVGASLAVGVLAAGCIVNVAEKGDAMLGVAAGTAFSEKTEGAPSPVDAGAVVVSTPAFWTTVGAGTLGASAGVAAGVPPGLPSPGLPPVLPLLGGRVERLPPGGRVERFPAGGPPPPQQSRTTPSLVGQQSPVRLRDAHTGLAEHAGRGAATGAEGLPLLPPLPLLVLGGDDGLLPLPEPLPPPPDLLVVPDDSLPFDPWFDFLLLPFLLPPPPEDPPCPPPPGMDRDNDA
jgi:hypothetical protein